MKLTYGVDDGYVGRSRPQYVSIKWDDLRDYETEEEVIHAVTDMVDEDFAQTVLPYFKDADAIDIWHQLREENREDSTNE